MNGVTTAVSLKGKWAHRTKRCATNDKTFDGSYTSYPVFIVDVINDGVYCISTISAGLHFLDSDWLDGNWREWPTRLDNPKGYKKEETMKKLVVGIERVDNIVFGKVLKMDEEIRGKDLLASGGEIIDRLWSIRNPALGCVSILVRGTVRTEDNSWFAQSYVTADEAKQVVEDIKMLVAKVNSGDKTEELTSDCGLEIIS